jgi:hypothetical protein
LKVCIPVGSCCNSGNNKERIHKNNTAIKVKMNILWKKSMLDVMEMFGGGGNIYIYIYSMLKKWGSLYTILNNKTFSMMWENHAMIERESRKKDCFVAVIMSE